MISFGSTILFSENPTKLVDFYKQVFDKDPTWTGGEFSGFNLDTAQFIIGPHDKVSGTNQNPERMMVNFETSEVDKEFERIKELGAKVIAEPYHPTEEEKMTLATFEDPDGNYFQLSSPFSR